MMTRNSRSLDLGRSAKQEEEHGEARRVLLLVCAELEADHLPDSDARSRGMYLAFTIPVSVFPSTNFPRVLIAVDNGVMPIDQMMVTITRPLEEAVNSVPGLQEVRSITSRGLGGDRSVLQLGRGHVPDAAVRECGAVARADTNYRRRRRW